MFVKIKLEDHGKVKAPHIFEIEDGATINDLKCHLESYVEIPAYDMQMQTLNQTIDDYHTLVDVVDQQVHGKKINGTAISLYINEKFHCFLQLYNKNEGDNQANFFSKPPDAHKLPIDTVPKYYENIIDSDESWHSTASETDSTENSNSSSSSDSSEDTQNLKRKHVGKVISPAKRLCPTPKKTESNLNDTFTKVVSPLNLDTNNKSHNIESVPTPLVRYEQENASIVSEESQVASKESAVFKEIVTHNLSIPISVNQDDASATPTAPYIIMKPEHRKYALVISNNDDGQQTSVNRQMEHLYELFESHQGCDRLNFSDYASISAFDDKLWVLCEDNETCDWIIAGVRRANLYKCSSLINYFSLVKCSMVLPQVVDGKQLENILQLLEMQNPGLCTKKWCVFERTMLEPELAAKAVTTLCKNEMLSLYVDTETKCFIQQHGSKLKYCFWKLCFEF